MAYLVGSYFQKVATQQPKMNKHKANHHQNLTPKQIPIIINIGKI